MATNDWANKEPLGLRSKLAVCILLLCVKILSPYEFGHQLDKEFEQLNKLIKE